MASISLPSLFYWIAISLFLSNHATCDTFDLGKLDQYAGHDGGPHDLKGVLLWVSGQDGKGFDAVFSGDLLKKLQDTLGGDSCKDKRHGDACFQALHGVLRSADMSVDKGLAKRDFYRLVSRSFLVMGAFFVGLASMVYAQWRLLEGEKKYTIVSQHIPQAAASSAGGLDMGKPLTISAEGSSIVVVTPTPDPTRPTSGHVALATTHITKDDKDYKVGDVVINLDRNEATRISDLMTISGCKDGNKRSLSSGLAAAGCAAHAVLLHAQPGGAFQELRGFQPRGPPLRFRGADIVRAANEARDVARELAPLIAVSPELIDHLAMMVFALGVEKFVDHVAIGAVNWIHGSTLSAGPTTPCPAKSCTASCEQFGVIESCETDCESVTACPAGGGLDKPKPTVVTVTTKFWQWDVIDAGPTPTSKPKPKGPERRCNGFRDDEYLSRDTMHKAVTQFCREQAVQNGKLDKDSGSISRKYFENTPGAVSISVDFEPGLTYKTSSDDCRQTFMTLADGCDVPHDDFNPANWKSGGAYTVFDDAHAKDDRPRFDLQTDKDGYVAPPTDPNNHHQRPRLSTDVKYWITPLSTRKFAPPADAKQGHCHVDYKFGMLYNGGEVWGAGWAEADNGEALKHELRGCALFPAPGFKLEYEQNLDNKDRHGDGREWTAYFRTGVGQRKCTGHAIGAAGGFGWGCSGGGA